MPYQRSSSVHSNGYSTDGRANEVSSGSNEAAPTYIMEHLATFTVSEETGIVYPADGMRRLLELETSNGIWCQKMQLRLDQNWVLIMDYESGAVMEKFPVALIQEPTAFTSNDPMDIYNNILVFIVGDEKTSNSRSEMHIFQCQSISAQELVDDLKNLRMGKAPLARRTRNIPPPPPTPPPEPPLNGVNVREQVNAFNAASHRAEVFPREARESTGRDPATLSLNDETSSTSSEKYERDVIILNHCFDDIEKFIARLQHAAAASRELERRRKNRKSKKKDMGDGMLTMRAKPPPEVEFVDIFQKFKLSFNLLAKLKAHIHDPNAPELVHFLFTPLALIVDASHDTHYGPNLPAKVVSPLLTREAVNLLINCVTSKETELWHSLGDAWLVPRDQWKGYVAPYHPLFMDGWSPEFPVLDEREHASTSMEAKRTHAEEIRAAQQNADYGRDNEPHYGSDYFDDELEAVPNDSARFYRDRPKRYSRDERERSQSPGSSDRDYPSGPPLPHRDITARSDISADSIERNGSVPMGPPMAGGPGHAGPDSQQRFERAQFKWLQDLKTTGAKVVQVTYPRTANNDKELTVIRGEYLEILDDSRKWWKARNSRGQIAHVPHTIVTPPAAEDRDGSSPPSAAPPATPEWHHFERQEKARQGKKARPALPQIPMPPPPPPMPGSPGGPPSPTPVNARRNVVLQLRTSPPGTPLGTPLGTPAALARSTSSTSDTPTLTPPMTPTTPQDSEVFGRPINEMTAHELQRVQLELMQRLSQTPKLDIVRTPDVPLSPKASKQEVMDWLTIKGLQPAAVQLLSGLEAGTLLTLQKDDLTKLLQNVEDRRTISRLHSQLLKQRAINKFSTIGSAEFKAALAKRRRKVDEALVEEDEAKTASATAC
ncbi:epidermal growth factor receptor kinase substrate 8-like isoform X2 [Thrips palmi]|uniref:Epidermal growth factor receptor kinase substrate 8-like isoform X2 n=1 Tax=Thrips palmi TaxID=161013 RepID=A0A6P8YJQ1_THRPL|nr:epidermal growth factor receptor kinase substrate 8-like isoform X2 [Thrips palmi]